MAQPGGNIFFRGFRRDLGHTDGDGLTNVSSLAVSLRRFECPLRDFLSQLRTHSRKAGRRDEEADVDALGGPGASASGPGPARNTLGDNPVGPGGQPSGGPDGGNCRQTGGWPPDGDAHARSCPGHNRHGPSDGLSPRQDGIQRVNGRRIVPRREIIPVRGRSR